MKGKQLLLESFRETQRVDVPVRAYLRFAWIVGVRHVVKVLCSPKEQGRIRCSSTRRGCDTSMGFLSRLRQRWSRRNWSLIYR
jgi:hypothetical protein